MPGRCALFDAVKANDLEGVKHAIAKGANVNVMTDHTFATPLLIAAGRGQGEIVEVLLAHGADPDKCDFNGFAPLHTAALNNHVEIAGLLLTKGASVNGTTIRGFSALHIAASKGGEKMANLLLSHGADIYAKNGDGLTPHDVAVRCKNREVAQCIEKAQESRMKCDIAEKIGGAFPKINPSMTAKGAHGPARIKSAL